MKTLTKHKETIMPNLFITSTNSQPPHMCPLITPKGTPCHFGSKVDCVSSQQCLLNEFLKHDSSSEEQLIRFLDTALAWCSCHNSVAIAGIALHYGISWSRFKQMSMCIWGEVLTGANCLFGLSEEDLMILFDAREKLVRKEIAKGGQTENFSQTNPLTTPITRPSRVTLKNTPTSVT